MFFCFTLWLLSACTGNNGVPTAYLAPTQVDTPAPLVQPTPVLSGPSPTPACTDDLHFLQDLTIPDNMVATAGSSLDKQWQVLNNGSCNWDRRYRLRFISGEQLGAPAEQALFPARSGTQAVIRIVFTAPAESGTHVSEWQAYDPRGYPFGDSFFIKIEISP